ncbi:uncharacterized protein LOC122098525 isoform X2 [Dipodomys spectabilis]|uniref:uncharacterized protein LOC122098525 isoform X2 n=1 Tax=Dipodomys spectabilis TaxID=105255 RepID=UPI001C542768|nr:uncharacterized protein LOC122098525 isoform X2 [Dipodomys spectabilis]
MAKAVNSPPRSRLFANPPLESLRTWKEQKNAPKCNLQKVTAQLHPLRLHGAGLSGSPARDGWTLGSPGTDGWSRQPSQRALSRPALSPQHSSSSPREKVGLTLSGSKAQPDGRSSLGVLQRCVIFLSLQSPQNALFFVELSAHSVLEF